MADSRAVDPRFAPMARFSSMRFVTYTAKEIRSISCKRISNPNTFDHLLHPNPGGLYDPALGPCDKQELCGTCGLNYVHCPGHLGHIALPLPVFHPIFFPALYQILRTSCFNCHRLMATQYKALLLNGQMQLLDKGLASEALELESNVSAGEEERGGVSDGFVKRISEYVKSCIESQLQTSTSLHQKSKHLTDLQRQLVAEFLKSISSCTKCPHCSAPARKVRQEHQSKVFLRSLSRKQATSWVEARRKELAQQRAIRMEDKSVTLLTEEESVEDCLKHKFLTAIEVQEHLRAMWYNDPTLLISVFSSLRVVDGKEGGEGVDRDEESCPTDLFFMEVVPVPPSRFRPVSLTAPPFLPYLALSHSPSPSPSPLSLSLSLPLSLSLSLPLSPSLSPSLSLSLSLSLHRSLR